MRTSPGRGCAQGSCCGAAVVLRAVQRPQAGGGAGLCGCCQGLRLGAHGRPSPRRGGASVGLAREGGPTGRTGPGGEFGRGPLRLCGQGRAVYLRGRLGFAVVHLVPAARRPIRGGAFVPCAFWCEGAGGASRAGGGWAPQRKAGTSGRGPMGSRLHAAGPGHAALAEAKAAWRGVPLL